MGRYPNHIVQTGLQMTIYQLAWELYFRPRLPGNPALKSIRIYDYWTGKIQEIPLRNDHEIGMLLLYIVEASEYYRGVLTGIPPSSEVIKNFRFFKSDDILNGDITPRLPRDSHCNYCSHFNACREWELGKRPNARTVFKLAHRKELEKLEIVQMSLLENHVVISGANSFHEIRSKIFAEQLNLIATTVL